jgi:cytochrome c
VASATGFDYSEALQSLEGNWNVEALDGFLYAPASHAPGTKMIYPGIKDDIQRINLIAYLHTLSDEPLALPAQAAGDGGTDTFGNTWPAGPGRDLTGFTCSACHSLEIVKQQGLSRESWDDLLDWMVNKQGMTEPDTAQRAQILDYLATHFGLGRATVASAPDDQFGTDWPVGAGRDITGYTCSACHSLAIVKQQGLSRESWDELLDWMVEEQGMGEPDPEQRQAILGYLATHFGIGGQ